MSTLTTHDFVRIAAEAVVSPATVARIYGGANSGATTRERVRAAAAKLRLSLPPERPSHPTLGSHPSRLVARAG